MDRKKKSTRRLILKISVLSLISFIMLLIAALMIFDHYVQFRKSDRQVLAFLGQSHLNGSLKYYSSGKRLVRYVSIGSDTLPTLFFLHGSPSSLSIYEQFFADSALRNSFRMVAPDRLGYGGSGFGDPEPSVARQAAAIWPLLRSLQHRRQPLIIVAGSYGTSVACRLMMDHPDAADGIVLIAPSLAPGLEKVFWFTSIVDSPVLSWALPRMLRSANAEKAGHLKSLTEMLPYWKNITIPVFYLQGDNDHLIYTSNAAFAKTHLVNCPHLDVSFLKGRPHFFLHSDEGPIVSKILECYRYADRLYLR